ncbi:cytochrome bd-I ubiquinol oxidase subunit 2 apoprotein [Paraburkholderia megapolitana]|uniref:Cytochrome bd-I ubiquinol oxidase subunit 2 apoprotein n=1 Tax=Paraburkholderia megapolitana TaxID=420953 RepID=A0A1I3Q387_9BURK|nr:cytochrome bd-I ubiquinol oxidase subunit 2 apoprotein [Paraburkholderia megapolitana]
MIDYDVLKVVWWALIGVLLIGFALTDGFDMGAGMLLPFIARTDIERRVVVNSVGATWEGNQVWLVTAGAAIFAAWPMVYATAFSGFYIALLLVLFSLFFRPVGFDYRSKVQDQRWRSTWDWALFVGSAVPALVFGVAFGNLLEGVPFQFDADMRLAYGGSFWALLNPFALLCGLVSVAMLVMHGAAFLRLKASGVIVARAAYVNVGAGIATFALFVIAGALIVTVVPGYQLSGNGSVTTAKGLWVSNYGFDVWFSLAPALGLTGALASALCAHRNHPVGAFAASSVSVAGVILTAGVSMFPFVVPSSTVPLQSLTMWNATSSRLTLQIMLVAVAVCLPIVLLYTAWAYRVMFGRVTAESVEQDHASY